MADWTKTPPNPVDKKPPATFSAFSLYYNVEMTSAPELEWVRRAKQGDREAYGEIVHCH